MSLFAEVETFDVESLLLAIKADEVRLNVYLRRTYVAGGLLLLFASLTVACGYGYPLHRYWNSLGKASLLLSLCALIYALQTSLLLFGAYKILKETKLELKELQPKDRT